MREVREKKVLELVRNDTVIYSEPLPKLGAILDSSSLSLIFSNSCNGSVFEPTEVSTAAAGDTKQIPAIQSPQVIPRGDRETDFYSIRRQVL